MRPASSAGPPERIGPYRILRELGRGGLGTVYLAERDDRQFSRRVALKVVRQDMESAVVLQRLRRERQILAELDHPNIARLYDGGATEEGLPYFAMEAIDGRRIDSWCSEKRATLRERLELMRRVCDAVHYAHRSLVLHRDLKPSNILVSQAGEPKLLDFGIAKVLEPEEDQAASSTSISAEAFTLTETGNLLFTPEFASPEQVRGENLTTASDIYSLGVILYLLVTGCRPYQLDRRRMAEVERVISSEVPTRASAAARRAPQLAAPDWSPPAQGDDLDNILAMALRKEPERRYLSAAELSEDLRRYLEDLPVHARPDTAGYRLHKFVRRHRWGVFTGAAFVALLLATVALTIWQARIAQKERVRAEGVASFLLEVFRVSDPYESLGNKITAREILDRSTARMKNDPSLSPDLRASLLETMGKVYQNLSVYEPAGELLEEARRLRAEELGQEAPEYRRNLLELGRLELRRRRFAQAEALLDEARAIPFGFFPDREQQAELERLKGEALAGLDRYEEAESLLQGILAKSRDLPLPERAEILESLGDLCLVRQDPKKAEHYYLEALELRRARFGELHPLVATNLNDLALALQGQGKLAEAEQQFRQLVGVYRALFGERHAYVSVALFNLAGTRLNQRDADEAEQLYRQALELRREIYGESHPAVAEVLIGLAHCAQMRASLAGKAQQNELRLARLEEAALLASQAVEIDRASFGENALPTLRDLFLQGELTLARGDAAAERQFLDIAAILRAKDGRDPRLATALVAVGKSRLGQNRAAAAEAPLREALGILGNPGPARAEAEAQLAFCLEKQGRAAEARELAGSALAFFEKNNPSSRLAERLRQLVAGGG